MGGILFNVQFLCILAFSLLQHLEIPLWNVSNIFRIFAAMDYYYYFRMLVLQLFRMVLPAQVFWHITSSQYEHLEEKTLTFQLATIRNFPSLPSYHEYLLCTDGDYRDALVQNTN